MAPGWEIALSLGLQAIDTALREARAAGAEDELRARLVAAHEGMQARLRRLKAQRKDPET